MLLFLGEHQMIDAKGRRARNFQETASIPFAAIQHQKC